MAEEWLHPLYRFIDARFDFGAGLNVGFVVPEILDGRFVPWESSLSWESYLDYYCAALIGRGHKCVKYVPSIGVTQTAEYVHKFGHVVKRIPTYNRVIAPRRLLRSRKYAFGYTTLLHPLLALPFTMNLLSEAKRDQIQIIHHASYYSVFFIPAFLAAKSIPSVAQYTGGSIPSDPLKRSIWKVAISPSLRTSLSVLLGDYPAERRTLVDFFGLPSTRCAHFDAPVVDRAVFHDYGKSLAQRKLGFDSTKINILCVTFIPQRHSFHVAKDPFLMVDIFEKLLRTGGSNVALYIAGWGQGRDELARYIEEKGLGSNVRILGMINHSLLPLYYSACDLVFVPFRLDKLNQGSATLEAFACHRPVAALKLNPEYPTEQVGGFLIDDSPEKGAEVLLDRLRLTGYLEQKGKEGFALSEQFSVEAAGKALEDIYRRSLKESQ